MMILDTNVVSGLCRGADRPIIQPWLNLQATESVWLTDIVIAELRVGVLGWPEGKGRAQLDAFYEDLIARFMERGRVASFTTATTRHFASGMAKAKAAGREVRSFAEGAIAAIALERRMMVATRDTGPFEAMGVRVVNPWADQ
ncbi:PIN domain-containing protein [Jannaschia aquimarina]|uniref:FitB_1 protein n=2 Tax=Jannaschia aquimarina TaxID=935700 RepID=A0A0D1CJ72_9RHOB|nr:PIN domain-containing protein [Jannaschia aquimarina]KIT14757.1 Toxin FitB [Jannaschia aquimarina]SNT42029.1 hypothetical protein SAMN05421775_1187 [Jannaschia aquimarina]